MNNYMIFECPECKIIRTYINRVSFLRAKRKNLKCNRCVQIGKKYLNRNSPTYVGNAKRKMIEKMKGRNPWNKGKTGIYSKETIKKISESSIGRKYTIKTKIRISNKMKHRIVSKETRLKNSIQSRIAQLKWLQKLGIPANTDNGATEYFSKLNFGGFNFKPTPFLNLGYIADGYDKKQHIWCEFDTPYHHKPYQQKKDLIRQNNIIKHFEEIDNPLIGFVRVQADKNGKVLETKCVYGKSII